MSPRGTPSRCGILNCDHPVWARGYCQAHYRRSQRGTPLDRPVAPAWRDLPLDQRFWLHVDKDGPSVYPELGPCWLWTGSTGPPIRIAGVRRDGNPRYGLLKIEGRRVPVTHVAWYLANGEWIMPPLRVLHRCDNPPCVRPSHLFVGTHQDNMTDMVAKGRQRGGARKLTPGQDRVPPRAGARPRRTPDEDR